MNLNDAIKAIESTSGFTDETTLVGEAWAIVLASLSPAPAPTPATQPSQHPIPSAILAHPGSRWGAAEPPIDFSRILSPEPGFERVLDNGDPERLPCSAQRVAGELWRPVYGSDSLNSTLAAIRDRLAEAHATASQTEPPADGEVAKLTKWLEEHAEDWTNLGISDWADKCTSILKLLRQYQQEQAEAAPIFPHISVSLASVLEAARIELDPNGKNGSLILKYLQQVATLPTAQPDLPKDPPGIENDGSKWQQGKRDGWEAARDELQRQREQAGAVPTAASTFPHISDDLMRSLVCDILYMLMKATDKALGGDCFSPIPEIRARLMEVLQLAAQDAP